MDINQELNNQIIDGEDKAIIDKLSNERGLSSEKLYSKRTETSLEQRVLEAPNDDELVERLLQSQYASDFSDFGVIRNLVSGASR